MKILGASKHGDIGRQLRINTDNIKSIAEINDTTDEELITLMQSESIEQDEPTDIVTLENTIISGNYDESSYFNLTKKLLLKNYVKQYNASRSGASVSETKVFLTLFRQNENEEYVLDMRPIENTINELSEILITKFNIDFRTNSESVSQDDYDIFGKSKNPVEEFKHIILNNRLTKDTNIRTNAPGENAHKN